MSTPNSPLKFYLGSGSKIKTDAIQLAINQCGMNAVVSPIKGAESGINEQPVGEAEILRGAINRVLSAYAIAPGGDIYFAIENGIQQDEESWFDYAIVLAYIPQQTTIKWLKSDAVSFPADAVEATREKDGGFTTNTVGKTLQEMGRVRQHDDPHLDLSGVSRTSTLKNALADLLDQLFR